MCKLWNVWEKAAGGLKGLKQEEHVISAQRSEDEPAARNKQHLQNQLQLETVRF